MIYKRALGVIGNKLVSRCSLCSIVKPSGLLNVKFHPALTMTARNFRWRETQETDESKFMVVGLGNLDMPNTRHSIGQAAVDELAQHLGVRWIKDRSIMGLYCTAFITDDTELVLVKSKQPMNDNGRSVHRAAHKWSIPSDKIYLLHDELDKSLGEIAIKHGGSAKGHNGVKSVINSMKNEDMHRVRIGIGRPSSESAVIDYVLHRFKPEERASVHEATHEALWVLLKNIQHRIKCDEDIASVVLP